MQVRSNFFTMPGGDTVQLTKTADCLRASGVKVDFSTDFFSDLSNYDLVHLSNVTRIHETYLCAKNAVKQKKPIALSTIYWPMEEFEQQGQIGLRRVLSSHLSIDQIERMKAVARMLVDAEARNRATTCLLTVGYTQMQQYVLNHANCLLPNSEIEMRKLEENFGIRGKQYIVIPNAIDGNIAKKAYAAKDDPEFDKYANGVICVGRIETRKNQLSLVKALDGMGYRLVLVGAVSKNHRAYYNQIMEIVERNPEFYYIPEIDNSKLYSLYKRCKVSALPSWLDTPGLVSLEAGSMGCNLVVSSRGSTYDYFGEYASYCEPDDVGSIRRAIMTELAKERNDQLRQRIFEKYTWDEASKKTKEAYEVILSGE